MFCLLRDLQIGDYNKGYYECLKELTDSPKQDFEVFKQFVKSLKRPPIYKRVLVYELQQPGETQSSIIGTGSVFFEYKTIHGGCIKAHIEDIVILKNYWGNKLGQRLIDHLKQLAEEAGSYKIELTCAKDKIGFYEACEFKNEEVAMSLRLKMKKIELGKVTFKPVNTWFEQRAIKIETTTNTSVTINGNEQDVNGDTNNSLGPKIREEFVIVSEDDERLKGLCTSIETDSDDNVSEENDTLSNGRESKENRNILPTKINTGEQIMSSLRSHFV